MSNKIDDKTIDMIEKYIFTLERKYKIYDIGEDAYAEAIIAYYKAIEDFNPAKGRDIRQWVYLRIWNTLNAFYKKERNIELTTDGTNAITGSNVLGNENAFGYDDIICEAMLEVIDSLNNLEKAIYLAHLEGDSLKNISGRVRYSQKKISNIIDFIEIQMRVKVKSVSD